MASQRSSRAERARGVWYQWVRPLLIVALLLASVRTAVADWNDVPSGSMNPTILAGDRIFVNKLAYRLRMPLTRWTLVDWSQPQRGEIVTFRAPDDGLRMVKRVVGVPGDVVEVRDGRLLINGEPARHELAERPEPGVPPRGPLTIEEKFEDHQRLVQFNLPRPRHRSFGPIRLGHDQFFMMGDNRDDSHDSRAFGPVEREQIIGRVNRVVLSVDPSRNFLPRWDRWLASLK